MKDHGKEILALSWRLKRYTYLCNWRGKVCANIVLDKITGIGNLGNFHLRALIFYGNVGVA